MTTTPLWPDWLDNIWAKSPQTNRQQGESLARHTWNVLDMLAQSVRLRFNLDTTPGPPGLWHCLFWACFLHDFGKAARGFQNTLRGGKRWSHRHEVLSLVFLDWIADALSEEQRQWVAAAIVSHHRDAKEIQLLYMDPTDPADDSLLPLVAEISSSSLSGLWRWLNECPASWIEALGLGEAGIQLPMLPDRTEAVYMVREQGASRVRHWLRGYRRWLRTLNRTQEHSLIIGTLALRGYVISSDHMASARVGPLRPPNITRPSDLLARWRLDEDDLYAHQQTSLHTHGEAILIAPTGSGKTEAALLWACAQRDRTRPTPRLFYTLPYQASMNAMYDRLQEQGFADQVGLEHSRSTLALYRRLVDDYAPEQAQRAARWQKNLARLNYFPVRVLSPYQILKGPYRLKGYEALLSDFFNAAFILDEVHAYEAGRMAIILSTVKYLREKFGARFFVMSATLPRLQQTRIADALGQHTLIRATPELFERFRRHRLSLMDGDLLADECLRHVVEAAQNRQSVLVCCNTVKRVQRAYDELCRRLKGRVEAVLLHGRFNSADRLLKETIVRRATSSQSKQKAPILLIATQAIEVSLDIDLDVIYTDPAPLEALIQRFGRINRRRRKEEAPVYVLSEPADGQGVYEDDLVEATLAVLANNAGQVIDEARVPDWLDEVYRGEIADRWDEAYDRAGSEFADACLVTLRAFDSNEDLEEAFYRAFDSIEVLPASMEERYRQLLRYSPLEASELLVPLRWGQFYRLRASGKVGAINGGWPRVVDAEYSSESGLRLD